MCLFGGRTELLSHQALRQTQKRNQGCFNPMLRLWHNFVSKCPAKQMIRMKWSTIGCLPRLQAAMERDSDWVEEVKTEGSHPGTGGEYSTGHDCP